MSAELMGQVFYLEMAAQRKLILLSLADNASDNGRCWPSQRLIALKSSISERRCRDHLHGLEADGWLSLLSQGRGRHVTTQYILNAERITREAASRHVGIKHEREDATASSMSDFHADPLADKPDVYGRKEDAVAGKEDASVRENHQEPSIEPPELDSSAPSAISSEAMATVPPVGNFVEKLTQAYEANVGVVTPFLAEDFKDFFDESQPPAHWGEDAVKEATRHNKHSWSYIRAILERWCREGRGDGHQQQIQPGPALPTEPMGVEVSPGVWVEGDYPQNFG